jgi:hypothetical protein
VPLTSTGNKRFVAHVLPLTSGARRRGGTTYSAVAGVFVRKASLDLPHPLETIGQAGGWVHEPAGRAAVPRGQAGRVSGATQRLSSRLSRLLQGSRSGRRIPPSPRPAQSCASGCSTATSQAIHRARPAPARSAGRGNTGHIEGWFCQSAPISLSNPMLFSSPPMFAAGQGFRTRRRISQRAPIECCACVRHALVMPALRYHIAAWPSRAVVFP